VGHFENGWIRPVAAAAALGALITGAPAKATVMSISDPVFGPNSLVLDTSTRLEWLDLKFTYSQTISQITASPQFGAFTYATEDEFNQLGENFFAPAPFYPAPVLDGTITQEFMSLILGEPVNPVAIIAGFLGPLVYNTPSDLRACNATILLNGQTGGQLQGFVDEQCDVSGDSPERGSFLIRPAEIPEPGSLGLLAAALSSWFWPYTRRMEFGT